MEKIPLYLLYCIRLAINKTKLNSSMFMASLVIAAYTEALFPL